MTYPAAVPAGNKGVLKRGLLMMVMAVAFQISATVLAIGAIVQFVLALLNFAPNARLIALGEGLGSYLRQITRFATFASEDVPFPFGDWPAPA